ncbi:glycoside hydrolase [Cantharellus anzutake]|uniref:glycoside hydrolase n=1 Tax=Cantharellus anzutake TaxID=1750568 RepID=UPI00190708A2|nr:glycoside hydrolase [Cantharellus anzutake]KAF8344144.1 glycoside hydrolase [Cantharellus anzutake]
MVFKSIFLVLASISSVFAAQATTTRYYDGSEGACGCGNNSGPFTWQKGISSGVYTAAASQGIFDAAGATWCGGGCGLCFKLTSSGEAPCSTCGTGGGAGQSIIVMVTNLCPSTGNGQWCPSTGSMNDYGYSAHFDIMSKDGFGWDNPVVDYAQVECPSSASNSFSQCVCATA